MIPLPPPASSDARATAPAGEAAPAVFILPIGSVQPVDAAGCIVNPCADHLVTGPWRAAAQVLVACCREQLGAALHSVHLRGSVPRGLALDGISDLDAAAVVDGPATGAADWTTALEQRVLQAHPGCRGVDLRMWPL